MSARGPYKITEEFERVVADYAGAPFAIAVDNMSNALFLALTWWKNKYTGDQIPPINIPARTYPSVACEIIHAGLKPSFYPVDGESLTGPYALLPTNIWDSALRFRKGMYIPSTHTCLSFTGPQKHLKLGKGGMILTDDEEAVHWFKKARFSGRSECSYLTDDFDSDGIIGWNFYMMPEIAARGLLLMNDFPDHTEDLTIEFPDLSAFKCFRQ